MYLIRAKDSTHQYSYRKACDWKDLDGYWTPESKNGTCYQYSDWDKYAIGNCTNPQAVEIWQEDRRFKRSSFLSRTIAGSVLGIIGGLLLILGVVYWRRKRKRAIIEKHGKAEELKLSHGVKS